MFLEGVRVKMEHACRLRYCTVIACGPGSAHSPFVWCIAPGGIPYGWWYVLGRLGPTAYGVVHLLLAWLAVRIALGGKGTADKNGALKTLAGSAGGRVLLWVIA